MAAGTAERAGRPSVSTFALARYNPNGSLDKTFGMRGRTTTKLGSGGYDGVEALVRQPTNGKLVAGGFVAGAPYAAGEKFASARYQP